MDDLSSVRNEVRLLLEEEVGGIRQEGMVDVKNGSLLRDHPEEPSHFTKHKNFNREQSDLPEVIQVDLLILLHCSFHHAPNPPYSLYCFPRP